MSADHRLEAARLDRLDDKDHPDCRTAEHMTRPRSVTPDPALEKAARIFRAAGDFSRLRILDELRHGERCVTELSEIMGSGLSTISQQLRILRGDYLVVARRDGKHVYYSLADEHVANLITNVLDHAGEDDD